MSRYFCGKKLIYLSSTMAGQRTPEIIKNISIFDGCVMIFLHESETAYKNKNRITCRFWRVVLVPKPKRQKQTSCWSNAGRASTSSLSWLLMWERGKCLDGAFHEGWSRVREEDHRGRRARTTNCDEGGDHDVVCEEGALTAPRATTPMSLTPTTRDGRKLESWLRLWIVRVSDRDGPLALGLYRSRAMWCYVGFDLCLFATLSPNPSFGFVWLEHLCSHWQRGHIEITLWESYKVHNIVHFMEQRHEKWMGGGWIGWMFSRKSYMGPWKFQLWTLDRNVYIQTWRKCNNCDGETCQANKRVAQRQI